MSSKMISKNEKSQKSNIWIKKEQLSPLLLLNQPYSLRLHCGHLEDAFVQSDLQYVHLSQERNHNMSLSME